MSNSGDQPVVKTAYGDILQEDDKELRQQIHKWISLSSADRRKCMDAMEQLLAQQVSRSQENTVATDLAHIAEIAQITRHAKWAIKVCDRQADQLSDFPTPDGQSAWQETIVLLIMNRKVAIHRMLAEARDRTGAQA
jgi:type I site-specific restriction endonuclease